MARRTWHTRWKSAVEDMINPVYFLAGAASYGPKWLALAACGVWFGRYLLLRAIWRHEDATPQSTDDTPDDGGGERSSFC